MKRPRKPGRSKRNKCKDKNVFAPIWDDSADTWESDLERELNEILEKAKSRESEDAFENENSQLSDCSTWISSLSLEEADMNIIENLWQKTLEGNDTERVSRLLNRISCTRMEAMRMIKRLHKLLELGILVAESSSCRANRFLTFYWDLDERDLLQTHIGLSSEAIACQKDNTRSFKPYYETGFQNSDEHLQAWFQIREAAWMVFNHKVGCHSIETIWNPDTDPTVCAMLRQLHNKEAKTKRRLKFKDYCAKYQLSDSEALFLVLYIAEEMNVGNDFEEFVSSLDSNKFLRKLLMHEALIRKFTKTQLHRHKLLKFDRDTSDIYSRLPIMQFELNQSVLAELYNKDLSIVKPKPRSDKQILLDFYAQNKLAELQIPDKNMGDLILSADLQRSLAAILNSSDHRIYRKLNSWGMKGYSTKNAKRGYLALFWGRPGTGKTLAAMAIAGQLGKAVLKTNSSHILSKWFGETEKKAERLLSDYYELCESMQNPPILLFNEADQLLTNRIQDPDSSVGKAWNATQSIFLEAMENPRGMIIATTNLLPCMDEAYSRRFDAVLEFKFPGQPERLQLWNLLLPKRVPGRNSLNFDEISAIPLSGGQIEKVIRNLLLSMVSDPSLPKRISTTMVITYCEKELCQSFERNPNFRKPIGFAHEKELR